MGLVKKLMVCVHVCTVIRHLLCLLKCFVYNYNIFMSRIYIFLITELYLTQENKKKTIYSSLVLTAHTHFLQSVVYYPDDLRLTERFTGCHSGVIMITGRLCTTVSSVALILSSHIQ